MLKFKNVFFCRLDDIEDNNALRRGSPTAHTIYGIRATVNSGQYVFFLIINQILTTFPGHLALDALSIYFSNIGKHFYGTGKNVKRGRGWTNLFIVSFLGVEMYRREFRQCPNEAEYLDIVANKTGALVVLFGGLLQLFSEAKETYNFVQIQTLLGVYVQMQDDYRNLHSADVSVPVFCNTNPPTRKIIFFLLCHTFKEENFKL